MSIVLLLGSLGLFYFLGYRGWSRILAEKVFCILANEPTPAHDPNLRDDIDFLPVDRHILWGHHYTSIAGAAPIIGPAVAVIWGWMPALFWIVFGTLFIGAVHDYGSLVISTRHQGRTMGDIAGLLICPRVRLLFQIIVYFLIWIVLAVFAFAIGVLFVKYPATVIPVNFQIIVALIIGFLFYKLKTGILIPSLVALFLLYVMIGVGTHIPVTLPEALPASMLIQGEPIVTWAVFLLVYAGIASVLPVWMLLQPRDYINSHQLIVGLVLLVVGLICLHPPMYAPMLRLHPPGAPPLFPFIFVTIACGAISGFHGLVSSGTTSKQLNRMEDARPIGYGGMLGEGILALLATLAVSAGLPDWGSHYASWNNSGINAIANFVTGAGTFVQALGIPHHFASSLVAVLAISFAATSMDTAARIQRMIVSEVGVALKWRMLQNRYIATGFAVLPAFPLVLAGKKVWGPLWLLFGTTNQLIGALSLLVLFVYLFRLGRPHWAISCPLVFLVLMTTGSMAMNLWTWGCALQAQWSMGHCMTFSIGCIILILEFWMIFEAGLMLFPIRKRALS